MGGRSRLWGASAPQKGGLFAAINRHDSATGERASIRPVNDNFTPSLPAERISNKRRPARRVSSRRGGFL